MGHETKTTLANQPSSFKGTAGTYQSTVDKQKKLQIRDNVEDSDEDDFLSLAAKRQATEPKEGNPGTNIEERQGTSSGGHQQTEKITIRPSDYETATEYTIAREAVIETNRRKNDNGGRETKGDGDSEIPQTGNKKRGRKQRLLSYSSQDSASSLDETSSRRSGRKRTAVTKMGAVMIDNIQKAEKPGMK